MIIRILMFPVILLLVLYFVIAQVVPLAKDISATKEEISKEETKLQSVKDDVTRAEAFQEEILSHSAEKEFTTQFVPNGKKEEILLSDISQIAEKTGVTLFSIGFSGGAATNSDKTNAPQLIDGKVIVSGSYENMKQFMHQMFRIKRLYGFKTFDLTKVAQEKTEEGEATQPMTMNGVVSFAYEYMPGMGVVTTSAAQQSINFDLITEVMNASSNTKPLVTETQYRRNPFLP